MASLVPLIVVRKPCYVSFTIREDVDLKNRQSIPIKVSSPTSTFVSIALQIQVVNMITQNMHKIEE